MQSLRPYRVTHQTLSVTAINFEKQSLVGYVEMIILPLTDMRKFKFNCKQCMIYSCVINDTWIASFSYNDPTLEICQGDGKQRNLSYFDGCHQTAVAAGDADNSGYGEVVVRMPQEISTQIRELKPFRLTVEFGLEDPKGAVKFVVPDIDGSMLDRSAHLFTYGGANQSRWWFPCIDSYSEICTWKLEYTVEMYMTAVSCGDLIETVYTPDLKRKTYHYFINIPTSASNIGLAVGPFEIFIDPFMHEVTHFCLPHLLPVLKQSVAQVHEAFEFYEELLSSRYPYTCYKQVFVDQAYDEVQSYATLSIFSTNLLFTKKVIDQAPISRQVMALGIAEQFFGCFVGMYSWSDAWLTKGFSRYLLSQYCKKTFGNNEFRYQLYKELEAICKYEESVGNILLDNSVDTEINIHFSIRHPHTLSPSYLDVFNKKSHLVVRMLEMRLGTELFLQVLNKILTLATAASQQKVGIQTWGNMLLSTSHLVKVLSTLTGKDINSFLEQWVYKPGVARFVGSFVFNRKRNVVELELRQDYLTRGTIKYVGPLVVTIQELDGTFTHTFQIEENKTKFEITCHSKSRRQKKKKIPLCSGEEIDMDLTEVDPDSPVLWLRIDPDLTILRSVSFEQPDHMWQLMLRYERCCIAQLLAVKALSKFPTPKTRLSLTDVIENDRCFYRVRIEAAHCFAQVANSLEGQWSGAPTLISLFRKLFASSTCPSMVRQNNFKNFQRYYLQKALPLAMASLRNSSQLCPSEVLQFLLELIKYNDNSKNSYTDSYYRGALIEALATTVTPAVQIVAISRNCPSTELLTPDTKRILDELFRALNMEKLLPSYRLAVTVSCLKAIRRLQQFGHLPIENNLFQSYACPGNFQDVRLTAIDALVDYTKVEANQSTLDYLLDLVVNDPEPYIRHYTLQCLVKNPPFTKQESSSLNSEGLVEKLWKMMNKELWYDCRLRCGVVDLYFCLFGRGRPACIPIPDSVMVLNLKEKRTIVNPSLSVADSMASAFPVEQSLKRRIESDVFPSTSYWESAFDSQQEAILSASQKKRKFKFGSDEMEVPSPMDTDNNVGIFPTASYSEYKDDFSRPSKLWPVRQENTDSVATTDMFKASVSIDESSQVSRLSESSDSNSVPHSFLQIQQKSVEPMPLPTSFSSDMFPKAHSPEESLMKLHKKKKKKKSKKHRHSKEEPMTF